ncbi:unnamed protein product [Caenorhabditis sp. 36 PRJEB53466]|nr:unnamed protein product [Caenorhabditis sp. 36 PRJEB53466]
MAKKQKKSGGKSVEFKEPEGVKSIDRLEPAGRGMRPSPSASTLNRMEREKIVIWRQPFTTIAYALLELVHLAGDVLLKLFRHKVLLTLTLASIALAVYGYHAEGAHQKHVQIVEKQILWWAWWVSLGVLSSIGLGSGLHTFLIYLGPHIAAVTMAAYDCQTLDFPEPPYPNEVKCPETRNAVAVTFWQIVNKVRVESLLWGAGTALGELPPYFMARAARISGQEPDDEEYREFIEHMKSENANQGEETEKQSIGDRLKTWVEHNIHRLGFPGILLFASIPNPLFDLAGITCGHFLVPFWSFFGATLIGKALVKMHVQMAFVILAFSNHHADNFVAMLDKIPVIGPHIRKPIGDLLENQKKTLHRKPGDPVEQSSSVMQYLLGAIVTGMIIVFALSIVNSLAKDYHKRLWERKKQKQQNKELIENEEEEDEEAPPSSCPFLSEEKAFEVVVVVKK